MYIYDITETLNFDNNKLYYKFNNGISHFKDDIYLMTYRLIYNEKNYHPWKLWFDYTPSLFNKSREILSEDYEIDLNFIIKDNELPIYDSTGLIIMKIINPSKYKIIYNIPFLFRNHWNHDTRIININNRIFLTYNSFIKKERLSCAMIQSEIKIDLENKNIKVLNEKFMNDLLVSNIIEKNWILLEDCIEYSINGTHQIIKDNKFIIKPIETIMKLKQKYNNQIYFSLSTPIINNIGIGHCKINYKHEYNDDDKFNNFKEKHFKNKILHGHLLYFFFFYKFDENYNITHMSNALMPYDKHYLLAFPIGFTKYKHDIFIISYGEGDAKCKLMYLHINEIMDKLQDINHLKFDFEIYNNN